MAQEETAADLVALARAVGLKGYSPQRADGSQEQSPSDPEAAELVMLARQVGLAGYSPLPDEAQVPSAPNPVSTSPAVTAPMTAKERATKRHRDEAVSIAQCARKVAP